MQNALMQGYITMVWHMYLLKSAPSVGIWTQYITIFLEPTQVSHPNGISISSAIFAQLTRVPNTQTDRHMR